MARPAIKSDLLDAADTQYTKLLSLINTLSSEELSMPFLFEDRDKSVRDVLIHLYEWHNLVLNWVKANQNGEKRKFLPEPYNWRTYPAMNIGFFEQHQTTSYDDAKTMLADTHQQIITMIESFSNDELFTKKYFTWSGTTNIGTYFVSSTSSHYDWAIKKIKKQIKLLR